MTRIYEREHEANHECSYRTPEPRTALPMERQFLQAYTNTIFYKCQNEIFNCVNLRYKFLLNKDGNSFFIVTDLSQQRDFEVGINLESKDVTCICSKFETCGILCCHCIGVMTQLNILSVQEKYIIDRWKKNVKRLNLMLPSSICSRPAEQSRLLIFTHYYL